MTFDQVVVAISVQVLLALVLVGIVARRRMHLSIGFAAATAAMLVTNALVTYWPGSFFTWDFWRFSETLQAGLYMLTTVELAGLIFAGLPRARRALFIGLAAAVALAAAAATQPEAATLDALRTVGLGVEAAVAWLLVLLVGTVAFFRVPLVPYHRAILLGLVVHVSLYSTMLQLVVTSGSFAWTSMKLLDPLVYGVVVAFWARAAWSTAPDRAEDPLVASKLQPWAVR